jgi:hypothetical protein
MGSFCCRWYAKRFLHPDIVEPYGCIFIWVEDLDLTYFDAEKYVLTQVLICIHRSLCPFDLIQSLVSSLFHVSI